MSTPLLAAAGAALIAAVLTVLLTLRCARGPRADLIAWAVAGAGLTLALAAQSAGFSGSFNSATFRAAHLGALVVAPLALVWGLAEAVGSSVGARFAARLALAALTVLGVVIIATDPLSSTTFSAGWPAPATYFGPIAHYMLELLAAVTVVWAMAAAVVAGIRSGRDPEWRRMFLAVLALAGATLVVQATALTLPANSLYALVCLIAAALTWFAARRAGGLPLADLHGGSFPPEQGWDDRRGGRRRYDDDTGYGGLYRTDAGGFRDADDEAYRDVGADTGGYGFYREDTGSFAVDTGSFAVDTGAFGPETGYNLYRADTGGFDAAGDTGGFDRLYRGEDGQRRGEDGRRRGEGGQRRAGAPGGPFGAGGPGGGEEARGGADGLVETGDIMPAINAMLPPGAASGMGVDTDQLYGQIAIYTLLEGRADEFDRLAKDVVDQVREREPNTMVYVLHGVPSAPMQRILYEVYRDSAAYEEHQRRPYVEHFEEQRKPFVLATNVIELGVRQAKVAPLQDQPPPSAPGNDFWTRGQR